MNKKIASAALHALKEALTSVYWYKSDLRSFLTHILGRSTIFSRLNWDDYKRNIVATLVDALSQDEGSHQKSLLTLMYEVAEIRDFSHLSRLDGGKEKVERATEAVNALREQVKGHLDLKKEEEEAERRREDAHKRIMATQGVQQKLEEIKQEYFSLLSAQNRQERGYELEKILKDLFELFDLDPKASFRIVGEQIDGAFTFEGTDYLFEAKWQQAPVNAKDMDSLSGKLGRKLENSLGLFLSINGFSNDAVNAVSSGRRLLILMDGSDLMAVLEGRINLLQLLYRKRRKASETGNIYIRIHELLN